MKQVDPDELEVFFTEVASDAQADSAVPWAFPASLWRLLGVLE
jgi:hypothetical protein